MLALGFGTNSEIFMGYKVPLKSDRQYLALQPKLEATVAHRNWFSLTFFFIDVKFSLDAEAAKFAPYFKIMLDQITYNDMCLDYGYLLSALELNLYTQINVLDCSAGFLGMVNQIRTALGTSSDKFGEIQECQWKNYSFEDPTYSLNTATLGLQRLRVTGKMTKEKCANPPPTF